MTGSASLSHRRIQVILNLASLFFLELLYYGWIANGYYNSVVGVFLVAGVIGLVLSFLNGFWRTGLWGLTHAKVENLDERQVMVTREALRYSYQIFVPSSLLLMFAAAVAANHDFHIFDAVLPAGLLYLSHILPASILAWREKVI